MAFGLREELQQPYTQDMRRPIWQAREESSAELGRWFLPALSHVFTSTLAFWGSFGDTDGG